MLIVGDVLVSDELIDKCFCCDLSVCKGACCIEGDAGAPVAPDEVAELTEYYPTFKKYMTEEGVATIEELGDTFSFNGAGEFETPLVPSNKACAFVCYENGMTMCAIEKAFLKGEIPFRKPISCYLYPIRASRVGKYIALNYHHWDICQCARTKGNQCQLPAYRFLKEPLVRAFGEEWYEELCALVETAQTTKDAEPRKGEK